MQINEQFWGGSEQSKQWVPGVIITNYNMLDAFNQTEGVTWTLPLNDELDTSICPWAINKDADILKLAYPISYRIDPDNTYDSAPPKFYPVHDYESEMSGIPIYFVVPEYAGGGANGFSWNARNGNAIAYIQPTTNTKYRDMVYPVRYFDYSKLCVSLNIVHTDNTAATDSVDSSTFDSYFSAANATWRTTNPIVGLSFRIYGRGWDSKNPDRWQGGNPTSGHQMLMNTMGRKKPCEIAPSGATVGYNVDFKDDFMTLVNGDAWGGLAIGAWGNRYGGNGAAYVLSDSGWALSYEQGAAAELAVSADDHPSPKVPMLEGKENTHWTIYSKYSGGSRAVYFKTMLDASTFANEDELKAYILKQAAYLGMWIYTKDTPTGDPGSSEFWYLGEIDENGVTTGNYRQGAATSELQNSEWQNPWDSSGWKGRDDDPTDYDKDQTSVITTASGDPAYNSKEYLMTENALSQLIRVLNEFKLNVSGELSEDYVVKAFGDTDPVNAIISVIKYPFDIIHNFNGNGTDVVIPGTNIGSFFNIANASIAVSVAPKIPSTPTLYTIDLTSSAEIYEIDWTNTNFKYGTARIPYYAKYKSFLDYEPYCTASLYVPFCGSAKLDPEIFVGHSVGVDYILSPIDGTVKAFVMRDNLIIDTLTGNMGSSIEINSSDDLAKSNSIQQLNATIQAQKMNNVKRWSNVGVGAIGGAVVGGGVGAVVGGIASAINAAFDTMSTNVGIQQKKFEIATAETPFKQLQSGGGFLSACDEYAVRLVVYRPETLPGFSFDDWSNYGHLYGFATYNIGKLSDFSGYVECSAANLDGIAATESEKGMIMDLLKGGVYV